MSTKKKTGKSTKQEQSEVEETQKAIKTMKSIYIEKNGNITYFIGSFKADDFAKIDGNASIAKSAFAHSDVEKILFKNCSTNIGEKAFEGCGELTTVIFGELEKDETIEKSVLKNVTLASASDDYTIQANAFKDCAKLTTLVLPKVTSGNLTIEKDAFCGCGALRTVVAICDDKVDFTGNPFADSPKHLTFICKENSDVARFARENGYRSVYVG